MEKNFLNYEQSLTLKELGFDEKTFYAYYKDTGNLLAIGKGNTYDTPAPLYQQAFRWFRKKHQLHSTITSISQESWQWHITKPSESLGTLYEEDFYTYEEAEDACINKLIEIAKESV